MKIIIEFNDDINIDDVLGYIKSLEETDGIKSVEIYKEYCNNCKDK